MSIIDRLKGLFGGNGSGGEGAGSGMISCEEALALIYEFLDGELEDVSHERVKAHFDVCGRCYPQLRMEESFRTAVRRAAQGETASPELKSRLTELLADAADE